MAFTLQLKRHLNYTDKESALNGLKGYLASAAIGEPAIATYGGGETLEDEKVLFGIKGAEDYTIFDADAIPSEVQTALDNAIAAIKGGEDSEIDDAYDTIKEIADALVTINGTGEGSISKALEDAKAYTDEKVAALDFTDTAVAGQYVDSVNETDGVVSVTRKPITSTDKSVVLNTTNGVDLSVNIDGTTILRDAESGKLSVASAALVQYVGADAIKVSEVQDGNKTISLAINTNDKVLTQTADGLLTNINLTWDKTAGLKLIGKEGTEIAVIPAADFIKDGMLEDVELKAASVEEPVGEATTGTFLVFTFNTDAGKEVINLDVTSLIDIYTAGNGIDITGKVVSIKRDASSEAFLTVGADGIKLSGVQDAINTASGSAQTAIDKIEASVGLDADGSHITTTGNYTSGATTIAEEISALDTQVKANADTILENEEIAAKAIESLATATGVLSGEEIKYVAPTVSGVFSNTTSVMSMLNKIDAEWNTIDCGEF